VNELERIRRQLGFSKKELFENNCNARTYSKYSEAINTAPLDFVQHVSELTGISVLEIYNEYDINLSMNKELKSDSFRIRSIEFMSTVNELDRIGDKELEDELVNLLNDFSEFEINPFRNPKHLNLFILYRNFFSLFIFPKFPRIDFYNRFPSITPINDSDIEQIEKYYWKRFKTENYMAFTIDLQIFANILINYSLSLDSLITIEHYFLPKISDDILNLFILSSPLKMTCYFSILSNYTQFCISNKHFEKATELIRYFKQIPDSVKVTDTNIAFKIYELIVSFHLGDTADYLKINQYHDILMTFGNKQFAQSIDSLVKNVINPDYADPANSNTTFVRKVARIQDRTIE